MSSRSKREYLCAIYSRYKQASRKYKTAILDEFCTVCGYHRKHAIRLLRTYRRFTKPKHKKKGKTPVYHTDAIITPLKRIWLAANLPCSKRLKAILPLWITGYIHKFGAVSADAHKALLKISAATIDRVLTPVRTRYKGRGRTTTKPGTLLRNQIPITERKRPVQFTRSRAYHKDDNAHVEQKNWTHVRQWLGYDRFDNPDVVALLNDLYSKEWRLFHNFFCPSVKLVSKKRIASKTIKRYDIPKTPYQRVLESPYVQNLVKMALAKQMNALDPFHLRDAMEKKLKAIFRVCSNKHSVSTIHR